MRSSVRSSLAAGSFWCARTCVTQGLCWLFQHKYLCWINTSTCVESTQVCVFHIWQKCCVLENTNLCVANTSVFRVGFSERITCYVLKRSSTAISTSLVEIIYSKAVISLQKSASVIIEILICKTCISHHSFTNSQSKICILYCMVSA